MSGKELIDSGRTALGIEFGSTRIKAVLTDYRGQVLAVGFHDWENSLINGIWTYSLDEIHAGLRGCYSNLVKSIKETYDTELTNIGAMGISAMMHGYMAFDKEGKLLSPFQTWRNSNTGEAADKLTEMFSFNIPLRWSIAHLYQCILDNEDHVKDIDYMATLDAYIHRMLTGEKVIGIGSASGMFPIDSQINDYDNAMLEQFDQCIAAKKYPWKIKEILPKVLVAGESAGKLTEEGAKFLDPTGKLKAGVAFCAPEGDAGTGMVATDSVAIRTGNVSAGTSVFAMIVLEKKLSRLYREIDMVTTPSGHPVAMSHANNCTSDLNAWVNIFKEFAQSFGMKVDMNSLFSTLYNKALEGDPDCSGLLAYGYYSGEGITDIDEGRPVFARMPDSKFTLANFMRANLYTALGAVKIGLDILIKDEHVKIDRIMGHGGFFKTKGVGQRIMAASVNAPVTVMETAGEGGPWGMAVLASYMVNKKDGQKLEEYLDSDIFDGQKGSTIEPDREDVKGFEEFMLRYKNGFSLEREAVKVMKE